MPRKAYSDQEREQIKENLLATAIRLIVERGLIHSSVDLLCKEVGISKTFFLIFRAMPLLFRCRLFVVKADSFYCYQLFSFVCRRFRPGGIESIRLYYRLFGLLNPVRDSTPRRCHLSLTEAVRSSGCRCVFACPCSRNRLETIIVHRCLLCNLLVHLLGLSLPCAMSRCLLCRFLTCKTIRCWSKSLRNRTKALRPKARRLPEVR